MKSVLIIGMGRFGRHMAQKLYDLGHDVLAIDKSEAKINKVLSYVTNAQIGDSTDDTSKSCAKAYCGSDYSNRRCTNSNRDRCSDNSNATYDFSCRF